MTTPTISSGKQPPGPLRMLADITERMEGIEKALDLILALLSTPSISTAPPKPDDEHRRHGEVLARAIREVSR